LADLLFVCVCVCVCVRARLLFTILTDCQNKAQCCFSTAADLPARTTIYAAGWQVLDDRKKGLWDDVRPKEMEE
jgi:hypothetical protein